jgi:tol-pal system protein YbgF
MRRNAAVLLFCCSAALFFAGCVTTEDMDRIKGDVYRLQAESSNQKKDISEIKGRVSDISKDITTLKEYSLSAMKESHSSLLSQTSDLSKELQSLKGRFDENKYFMDKAMKDMLSERELQQAKIAALENEIKELKAKAAAQAQSIEKALEKAAEKKEPATSQETAQPSSDTKETKEAKDAKASESGDPQKLYDDAQIDFKETRYAESRRKFEKFTKDFSKHNLAPNAFFYIGEADYADKKYEDAILAYETFLKKYPANEKAKAAMLKQAFSFLEIGDKKTGKVLLEKVLEKYPNSREAGLAEKRIADILSKNSVPAAAKKKKK